jgi:hypothetical protein
MPASIGQVAKRAFVKVLLELAALYGIAAVVNRDSPAKLLESAFKRVSLKAHPDKGGKRAHFQKLQAARENWQKAQPSSGTGSSSGQAASSSAGRPQQDLACSRGTQKAANQDEYFQLIRATFPGLCSVYRVTPVGIMLTYQTFPGPCEWQPFCEWVQGGLRKWKVKYWCATMEICKKQQHHVHLMLQFFSAEERTTQPFWYKGKKPNASTNDLCGEGQCRKKLQQSLDRGFFYTFASKIGTAQDESGTDYTLANYWPAWTKESKTYQVLGKWPETLWKQYKLSNATYEDYLFKARDFGFVGVVW